MSCPSVQEGQSAISLKLDGSEALIVGLSSVDVRPRQPVELKITRTDGSHEVVDLILRIATPIELEYYKNGGILPFVLRQLIA